MGHEKRSKKVWENKKKKITKLLVVGRTVHFFVFVLFFCDLPFLFRIFMVQFEQKTGKIQNTKKITSIKCQLFPSKKRTNKNTKKQQKKRTNKREDMTKKKIANIVY